MELAERKARAAAALVPGSWVLTADTLVFLGEECLGKPRDEADAVRMLERLAGRTHSVWTGVALARQAAGALELAVRAQVTEVRFRSLSGAEIRDYVATGEPLDKAGAYALQGGAGAFVAELRGSADTVIGLPIALVRELLAAVGVGPPPPPSASAGR